MKKLVTAKVLKSVEAVKNYFLERPERRAAYGGDCSYCTPKGTRCAIGMMLTPETAKVLQNAPGLQDMGIAALVDVAKYGYDRTGIERRMPARVRRALLKIDSRIDLAALSKLQTWHDTDTMSDPRERPSSV